MDHDTLLKLLDLSGRDSPDDLLAVIAPTSPPEPSGESGNPTALEMDDWGLRRGRELLSDNERLRELGIDAYAAADFHAAAFHPDPVMLPGCIDRRRHDFLVQMYDTSEYQALHTETRFDDTASAIAAVVFAEQFIAMRKEDSPDADEMAQEMATLRAVGKALADAREGVDECRESATAMGMESGSPGTSDSRAVAALFRRVRSDPKLRRICELAGRYRRLAQSRQRRKVSHGFDDIVGVEPGGDVARLLPHELAKLAIPELELDTLRRLAERQTLCRAYHSVEPVGKGPIIVAIDESGSMEGEKVHTAKALALALAWIARQQQRWVALIAYSGDSGERLLSLHPGRWNETLLMDWLCGFIGRGSSLDVPVREMPQYYRQLKAPPGVADLIFITDCICRIPEETKRRFLKWKLSVQARLITLVIASKPGDLVDVSDEVHLVANLQISEAAVGRVLSI